jgi:hypothetical protein
MNLRLVSFWEMLNIDSRWVTVDDFSVLDHDFSPLDEQTVSLLSASFNDFLRTISVG